MSRDTVTYRVPAPAGALTVDVELMYQTLRPIDLDALAAQPTDATRRFFDMVAGRAPTPLRMARAEVVVPIKWNSPAVRPWPMCAKSKAVAPWRRWALRMSGS